MMDQEAHVTDVEGDYALVEVGKGGSGCGRCHEKGGCQSSIIGQLFGGKPRKYRIRNRIGALPGERVIIRVTDGATLLAALLAYAFPVLFLLLGAVIGTTLAGQAEKNDLGVALGALGGLAAGVLTSIILRATRPGSFDEPELIRLNSRICISEEACR